MSVKVRETSRLRFARLYDIEGVECWGMPEYPTIDPSPDDISYTVARLDRIDLLAYRFYDSAELWWVIALANDLWLLPNDLKENMKIRIPSPSRVYTVILKGANRGEEGR
jgi:hypothetical protein